MSPLMQLSRDCAGKGYRQDEIWRAWLISNRVRSLIHSPASLGQHAGILPIAYRVAKPIP